MNCVECNVSTKNPKFCSRSCSAKHNNRKQPKRKKLEVNCVDCGVPCDKNAQRCRGCFIKHKTPDMTLAEATYKEGSRSNAFGLIRVRARTKMKNATKCERCGYSKHVHICHKKAIYSFNEDDLISKINADDNLAALCPNCHWEFDNNLLDL